MNEKNYSGNYGVQISLIIKYIRHTQDSRTPTKCQSSLKKKFPYKPIPTYNLRRPI